jgi:hypothetical protein
MTYPSWYHGLITVGASRIRIHRTVGGRQLRREPVILVDRPAVRTAFAQEPKLDAELGANGRGDGLRRCERFHYARRSKSPSVERSTLEAKRARRDRACLHMPNDKLAKGIGIVLPLDGAPGIHGCVKSWTS